MLICLKLRAGRTTIQRDRDMLRYVIVSYSFVRQSEKKYVLLVWYCFLCIFQKIAFLPFEAQNVSWTRKSISESEWALLARYVCLHIQLIVYSDRSSTVQQNDSKRTGHWQQNNKIHICNVQNGKNTIQTIMCEVWHVQIWNEEISMCGE